MTTTNHATRTDDAPLVVVLVEPHHPGNIGATARAMSNMGVRDLRLVNPCPETSETRALAWNATNILDAATHYGSLLEALQDCVHTYGFSARSGKMRSTPHLLPDAAQRIDGAAGRTALVFGREDSGLTIDEYELCQDLVRIPTAHANTSLNLSQAVMVALYEIVGRRRTRQEERRADDRNLTNHFLRPGRIPPLAVPKRREHRVETATFERLMADWTAMITSIGYGSFGPKDLLNRVVRRLRRVFHRAQLSNEDADMLLGVSRRVQGHSRVPGTKGGGPPRDA